MPTALVRTGLSLACLLAVAAVSPSRAAAQSLGTFSWQLQPFCNVITVTVTQLTGSLYTLHGYDDGCGAPQRAPLTGIATLNPDGTIGFGLHTVNAPTAAQDSIEARIGLATLSGTWQDGSGNSGAIVFGGVGGGSPRPVTVGTRIFTGPAVNFATTSIASIAIPMPLALFNRGSWNVYLVSAEGNVYPIPGPGLNNLSTYRTFAFSSSGQTRVNVSLINGDGEEYAEIRIVRVQ